MFVARSRVMDTHSIALMRDHHTSFEMALAVVTDQI